MFDRNYTQRRFSAAYIPRRTSREKISCWLDPASWCASSFLASFLGSEYRMHTMQHTAQLTGTATVLCDWVSTVRVLLERFLMIF
jgi:hypothetical protein